MQMKAMVDKAEKGGTATLNVRIPKELKERGMQVLEREGVSVSELVRDVFKYMEAQQELPVFAGPGLRGPSQKEAECERRRAAMRSLIGILPPDVDIDAARHERLMRKTEPGIRS